MPPVESYQRIDIQNPQNPEYPEKSSRQIHKKSIDQTLIEARIENRSVRDTIEDSVLSPGNVAATDTVIGQSEVPESEVPESEVVESDGSSDSVDVLNRANEHYRHTANQTGDQVSAQISEGDRYFTDVDIDGAANDNDIIEAHRNHTNVSVFSNGSTNGVDRGSDEILAQQSIKHGDDARLDPADNLTVEQAFDFLTQQIEDDYVQPSAFATKPTHST